MNGPSAAACAERRTTETERLQQLLLFPQGLAAGTLGVQIANETLSYPSPSYLLPDGPVLAESVHSVNLYDHPVRTIRSLKKS